jgi:hypothetical protein
MSRVYADSQGIDVQAELHAKSSSPNFGPTRVPASAPSGPQGMRFAAGKFGRRPLSISAKPDQTQADVLQNRSPLSQPNSASHLPSPIAPLARSPNFLPQAGANSISPSFGPTIVQAGQQQLRPAQNLRPQPPFTQPTRPTTFPMSSAQSSASGSSLSSAVRDPQGFFVPAFQNHYDQLGKFPVPLSKIWRGISSIELCRPRFNPLVQIKSTTPKQVCWTIKTPKPAHSRRRAFQHRVCPRSSRCNKWVETRMWRRCSNSKAWRHLSSIRNTRHNSTLKTLELRASKTEDTIPCWMRIRLDCLPVCISPLSFRTILKDEEGC